MDQSLLERADEPIAGRSTDVDGAVRTEGFEWSFDFTADRLEPTSTTGQQQTLELKPLMVRDFYHHVMEAIADVGMPVTINTASNEITDPIPFPEDDVHAT